MARKVVYKATNTINGKVYIGVDSNWPRRIGAHKTKAKNGSKLYFHNAIRKYGFNSFVWDILYEGEDILEKEQEMINEYQTMVHGYNMTLGGEGIKGYKHSEEIRILIGEHSKGNKNTLGKTWKKTPQAVENSANSLKELWEIITPDGEKLIIKGLREFAKQHNLWYQNLWQVHAGKRNHTKGYRCRKIND